MTTIQNSVMLIGHLGDNPEEVKLDSKKKVNDLFHSYQSSL